MGPSLAGSRKSWSKLSRGGRRGVGWEGTLQMVAQPAFVENDGRPRGRQPREWFVRFR